MGDDVSYVQAPDISIIRVSVSAKNDNAPSTAKQINYEGKLLMGAEAKEPLVNKKVILEDDKNTELQNTVTDKYGDFSFKSVEASKSYHVKVDANGPKIKDGQLYIAKQNGTIINSLKKSGNFYVYELLPAELSTLKKEKEEDTELKLADFSSSDKTELTVLENIYYVSNSTENNTETIIKLDKVSEVMKKNKAIKLAISSHTDSKGDDNSNLVLSEKRAQVVLDYFVRKGIEKHRLSAKGYGETQIKNRCKNGVDCSEKEQELNRRTEFKFTK
ncbi:MAG: OmpA family protein [Nitrosopumilus sp.]|nr:OmpA family protein [Nitrosopumilus sp.]